MTINNKNFFNKYFPVDKFIDHILYNKKFGYYFKKEPFGNKGDYITSPLISDLFSEMIAIWIIDTWQKIGSPKNFNIIELGPGNGALMHILNETFKNFPKFYSSVKICLFEKSERLKKIQKKNISDNKIKWISTISEIKKGPLIFIGNEFFDAIPIKQFKNKNGIFFEKNLFINKDLKTKEIYKKALSSEVKMLKKFNSIKKNKFIEFPKMGFSILKNIIKKIKKNTGGILLIDYGYVSKSNIDTLQSIKNHKKNKIFENLGDADITSLVNFKLLNEYFIKNKLEVKNIVSQSIFLKTMGIIERANILSKKMNFKDKADLFYRLKRLLSPNDMGELFKVIFAYKSKNKNFIGFG